MGRGRLDRRLLDEFVGWGDADGEDQPELHLVGLAPDDLLACLGLLEQLGASWGDWLFHIDAEGVDVRVADRPDVAELVVRGETSTPCITADGVTVDGVALPAVSMFLHPDSIEFFWDAGSAWTERRALGFLTLMARLLDTAPRASLRPDPHLPEDKRRVVGRLVGEAINRPHRIDYANPRV